MGSKVWNDVTGILWSRLNTKLLENYVEEKFWDKLALMRRKLSVMTFTIPLRD